MTKADLLNKLKNVPMNTPIVFATTGDEYSLTHAYVVTGGRGIVLVLADTPEIAEVYDDAEEVL